MALLIHLSLLLATVQQLFVLGSTECPDKGHKTFSSTAGEWNIECNHVTLKIVVQTLVQCMPNNSSETCLDISYHPNKCISLCLKEENGSIKLAYECKDSCDGSPRSATQVTQVTINSQLIDFTPRKICLPSVNQKKIKIKFKCTQHTVSICTADDRSTYLQLYQRAKSWIDALEHCQRENSSLVEITNQTENNKLNELWQYKEDLQRGVWIGLERSIFGNNPEWKWISGSKAEYSQWNSSYPVNPLNYHCGKIILVSEAEKIKWLNDNCHEKLPYICQSLKERPCHNNNVTTLNAELCIEGEVDFSLQGITCQECHNIPTKEMGVGGMGIWRSGNLCVSRCPDD